MIQEFKPTIRAALPDGWFAKESISLLAADGQANVIASSEPLDATIDTYHYAQLQGDLLQREFDEYEQLAYGPRLMFGGRPGHVRTFAWKPKDSEEVTQIQFYYAEAGRGYTATATTPSSEFGRYEQLLRSCLDSLVMEPQA